MGIEEIEGIGPEHASKLTDAGVATTAALLERGAQSSGRAALAAATGIDAALILEWVNHADLMRIRGVGSEYSDLLEAAGVDSPPELARRNATNLANTFQEVVAARPGIVRRIPTEAEVVDWIEQAKALPRVVEHGGGGAAAADPKPGIEAAAAPDHDQGHDHVHDHGAAAHEHLPAAPAPAPEPAPVARGFASAPGPAETGLWSRIKRMLGIGSETP